MRYIGLAEVPGKEHQPVIVGWLKDLRAWWSDDETPWCGTFVAHCMRSCNIPVPQHWYRAKAWASWGRPLFDPVDGCIGVFDRAGGGHVGFIVGRDTQGRYLVLGGNQGNRVSIVPIDAERLLAARWPEVVVPQPPTTPLPLGKSAEPSSTNEA